MFPDIIKKIPARDYKMDGLEVHVDHTSTGTIYFVSAEKEVVFPEHSHAGYSEVDYVDDPRDGELEGDFYDGKNY